MKRRPRVSRSRCICKRTGRLVANTTKLRGFRTWRTKAAGHMPLLARRTCLTAHVPRSSNARQNAPTCCEEYGCNFTGMRSNPFVLPLAHARWTILCFVETSPCSPGMTGCFGRRCPTCRRSSGDNVCLGSRRNVGERRSRRGRDMAARDGSTRHSRKCRRQIDRTWDLCETGRRRLHSDGCGFLFGDFWGREMHVGKQLPRRESMDRLREARTGLFAHTRRLRRSHPTGGFPHHGRARLRS